MKVWIMDSDVDNYENLAWSEDTDLDYIHSFDGRPKANGWGGLSVKRMYDRDFSNTPGLSPHIPVFDSRAAHTLKDLIVNDAELLSLTCPDGDFYAVNVTKVLDCIDYNKSEYKMFRDGKRIMRFVKYSFIKDAITGVNIFRIKDMPLLRPFVSDQLKSRVENSDLCGFKFELAWDSEEDLGDER